MNQHQLTPNPNFAIAYTDGACRGNGKDHAEGGYGAVVILPNGEQLDICGGEKGTTNNKMELLGAIVALENSPVSVPIQIWTDSGYVKDGITKWLAGWKKNGWRTAKKDPVKNQDLWQRLDIATQNRQIDWQWVKGHAGHDGNEYADRLANRGIDNLPKTFEKLIKNPANVQLIANSTNMTQPPETNMTDNANQPPSYADNMGVYQDSYSPDFNEASFNEANFADYSASDFQNGYQGDYQNGEQHDDFLLSVLDEENAPQPASAVPVADFAGFTDGQGNFIAQDDALIAQRPQFDGNTTQPNPSFVPLLPLAKNAGVSNRQLILDTETTGFEALNGDRIIEVGVVELINRKFTGEKLHVYLNPHKLMDDEVIKVHGIHNAFLDGMPSFEQVGRVLYDFLQGAEIVAHNASFDMNFLQAEFERMGLGEFNQKVSVVDSLAIAKQQYAGQRNTLDALVKRLNVGKQDRTFHGALLDAEILAEVYLAMTGGQVSLAIDDVAGGGVGGVVEHSRFDSPVARFVASAADEQAHLDWVTKLADKHPQLADNWGVQLAKTV